MSAPVFRETETPLSTGPAKPAARPLSIHAAILFGLLIANLLLYYRTVAIGFLSVDDPDYVQNNPYIEKLSTAKLKFILTKPEIASVGLSTLAQSSI